jgi:glycosyltransferase involved in cell wall biosynthesis
MPESPRVLLLTDADVFAGTERHILSLACALRQEGVTVHIGCPAPSPLAERAGEEKIPVIAIPKRGSIDRQAARLLRGLIRRGDLQIIHAHNGRTALAGAIALRGLRQGKLVISQHFLEPAHARRRGAAAMLSRVIHHWINARADRFIAVSQAVADAMRQREGLNGKRVNVIHNGLAATNAALLRPPTEIRAEFGIDAQSPLIVCAARLEPEKDIPTLIEAMKIVHNDFPDTVCLIAGKGSQQDRLKAQISNLKLQNKVLLAGFREDALSLINAGDCFVLPSLAEPFGLVLLEAMALSKPVVATSVAGPREIVDDGVSGLLVPPADPQALAAAICRILRDRSFANEMGRRGKERFENLFSDRRMAAATAAVYRELLPARKDAHA